MEEPSYKINAFLMRLSSELERRRRKRVGTFSSAPLMYSVAEDSAHISLVTKGCGQSHLVSKQGGK